MSRITKFIRSKIYGDGPDPQRMILDEVDARTMMKSYDAWTKFCLVLLAAVGVHAILGIAVIISMMAMMNIVMGETSDLEDTVRFLGSFTIGLAVGVCSMVSAIQAQLRNVAKNRYEKDMEELLSSRED